jgi:serine/threonine protein kinase
MTDSAFADIVQQAEQRIGTTLKGKWRIDRLIGVGGMASVYAATHRNNKRVAIKMLHPALSMLRTVRERFQREGYVANSVGHAGAVSVDDDDVTEDGCAFLVMELLEGETLEVRRTRVGGRLSAEEVLSAMDHVLGTLAAAHAKGIVHRDLKPDNLFVTRNGDTKILDFGIARLRDLALSTAHTHTGNLLGTPAFMPPEQARGHWDEVDGQSDLWAVGATMYALLTGDHVHRATTANDLLITAATTRAESLASRLPGVHPALAKLVDRALAFDKVNRWPDATTMRRAVRKGLVLLDDPAALAAEAGEVRPELASFSDQEWSDDEPTGATSVSVLLAAQKPFADLRRPSSDRVTAFAVSGTPVRTDAPVARNERLTTTPGVEQSLVRRVASGSSVTWALCAFLAAGVVSVIVFAKRRDSTEHAPAANASAQSSAEAPAQARVAPNPAPVQIVVSAEDPPFSPPATAMPPMQRRPPAVEAPKPSGPGLAAPRPSAAAAPTNTADPSEPGLVHRNAAKGRQMDDAGQYLFDNPYH